LSRPERILPTAEIDPNTVKQTTTIDIPLDVNVSVDFKKKPINK